MNHLKGFLSKIFLLNPRKKLKPPPPPKKIHFLGEFTYGQPWVDHFMLEIPFLIFWSVQAYQVPYSFLKE